VEEVSICQLVAFPDAVGTTPADARELLKLKGKGQIKLV
jgi:hypothetical protein